MFKFNLKPIEIREVTAEQIERSSCKQKLYPLELIFQHNVQVIYYYLY